MTSLPRDDPNDVARRSDIDRLEGRIDRLELGLGEEIRELRGGLTAVNDRLDRLFLGLIGGLVAIIATVIFF